MIQWPNLERYLRRRFAPAQKALNDPMRHAWLALPSWLVLKRVIPPEFPGGVWLPHAIPLLLLAGLFIARKLKTRQFANFIVKSAYPYDVMESLGKLSCHAANDELEESVERRFGDQWELAISAYGRVIDSVHTARVQDLDAEYPGLEIISRAMEEVDAACIECLMAGRTFVRELHEKPKAFAKRMAETRSSQAEFARVQEYVQAIETYAGKIHDLGRQEEPLRVFEDAVQYLGDFRTAQARKGAYRFSFN